MKLFENLSNIFPDNTAVISDTGEKISYAKLENLADYLSDNIPGRTLVFSLNKNTTGSLVGYYSFVKNKVVPLMLEAKIDTQLLDKLISIYSPEYLWLPTEECTKFQKGEVICSVFDYSLLKLRNHKTPVLHEDLALLLGTSGSTGSPKLVKLTYNNIKSNALSIIKYLDIGQNERPITSLPMSYSFGLSIINSHLYSGACLLLTNRSLFEKEFWTFLKKEKATSLSGVPYTFEMLKKLRFFRQDLPHLKTLTQAGGKLNNAMIHEFSEYAVEQGKRFFVMYGQTEATARMSYLPPENNLSKLGSMGIAIPGGEFSLIDEKGSAISGNEKVGELVYRGDNVCMGYAESAIDLQKGDENNRILFTGDIAKRDQDDYYYIVGRMKRFIKLFGNRINLDETEQILKSVISDCACIGSDEKMIIYITEKFKIKEIQEFISLKTGIHHSAFSVNYISEIPKNSSGKTTYSKLELFHEF